jgi:hypothetical protein
MNFRDNLARYPNATGYSKGDAENDFQINIVGQREEGAPPSRTKSKFPKKGKKVAQSKVRKPKRDMLGAYVELKRARSPLKVLEIERVSSITKEVIERMVRALPAFEMQTSDPAPLARWWYQIPVTYEGTVNERRVSSVFVASATLTDFWIRGLRQRSKKTPSEHLSLEAKLDPMSFETRREFGELIVQVIAVMAYTHQHEIDDFSNFGMHGRFYYAVIDQILSQVPILGDEATAFFDTLYRELVAYLRNNSLDGDWGTLTTSDSNIRLTSKPAQIDVLSPGWQVAKLLE